MTELYIILPWDSDFFGFRVARIVPERLSESELRNVLSRLDKEQVRLAYWLSDPGDPASQGAAAACEGFLADRKTTYAIDLDRYPPAEHGTGDPAVTKYSEATPSQALYRLALESGRYSRFRMDKNFPDTLFRKLYEHWMSASVGKTIADEVFVARDDSDIIGMVTVKKDSGHGKIGLIAVDPAIQGRGVGSSLIAEAHRWFRQEGLSRSRVVTQGANIIACKLYVSCGYRLESVDHLHHFWIGPHDNTLQ
jgi:dTDP-4-amino-4,6-dideoxy-D-galactose acyltransferase